MVARDEMVTEVLLSPALPQIERHQRLHQHLAASPYSQGAIYVPAGDTLESPAAEDCAQAIVAGTPASPAGAVLMLRGKGRWRLGGRMAAVWSPPWSWKSEELCGYPFPYCARDLSCLASVQSPAHDAPCAYHASSHQPCAGRRSLT